MNITIGVYDLFTYAIPGSLHLALLAYIGDRTGWVDVQRVDVTSAVGLVAVALVAYLLGHVTYGTSRRLERRFRRQGSRRAEARAVFVARHPDAAGRPFVEADFGVLRAAIDLKGAETGLEVRRLHAVGGMLRGCAPALGLAALVAGTEMFAGERPLVAGCAAVLLAGSAVATAAQGRRLMLWAHLKTLELALWIEGIDRLGDALDPDAAR